MSMALPGQQLGLYDLLKGQGTVYTKLDPEECLALLSASHASPCENVDVTPVLQHQLNKNI